MIESLYEHRILPKQYVAQAADREMSITIIVKEKKIWIMLLFFLSPSQRLLPF